MCYITLDSDLLTVDNNIHFFNNWSLEGYCDILPVMACQENTSDWLQLSTVVQKRVYIMLLTGGYISIMYSAVIGFPNTHLLNNNLSGVDRDLTV